ncbi:hypothetical protein O3P69_005710 [Scylla paramamosain]|uniref:C2H2-type domain-containing protein n=1 Tax=Scylla paramamosain TaxID=85552 RepID=A0AAW0U6S9_SCYPA
MAEPHQPLYPDKVNKVTQTVFDVAQHPQQHPGTTYGTVTHFDDSSAAKEQNKLRSQIEMWLQSGEKPLGKKFECDECGKRFSLESHLNSHRFMHSEKKGFDYQEYAKLFTQKNHVNSLVLVPNVPNVSNVSNENKVTNYEEANKIFNPQPYQPAYPYGQLTGQLTDKVRTLWPL